MKRLANLLKSPAFWFGFQKGFLQGHIIAFTLCGVLGGYLWFIS